MLQIAKGEGSPLAQMLIFKGPSHKIKIVGNINYEN